jgi:fructokinase
MRIGVDVGGTKLEAIALGQGGETLFRHRVPTPAGDYAGTLEAIAGLVELAERETGRVGSVGAGTPGAISQKTGLLKNSNSTALNGKPFDRDLAARLGRPVRLENDANCFTLSEGTDGAGQGAGVVFGVILGTGVGGGIAVDGRLVSGPNAISGEWGHNSLPWARPEDWGPPCYCGKSGCIETYLSGPGLTRDHAQRTGKVLSGKDIAALLLVGDAEALASMDLYLDRLARGLASVVNILDPDMFVLGGGLSNIERLYNDLPALIEKYVFSDSFLTPIRRAIHGDSSGVRGAAWLWPA